MTLDSPQVHRISVAPLILSNDDPSFIGRLQKSGALAMVERLGSELGADRISDDLVSDVAGNPIKMDEYALFSRPCVFLVFFDEHARMKLMLGKEYRLLQCHVAALPVYCYLPSMGNVPFKIKLEEVHGLNSGRPFNIMCLDDNWEVVLPEMLQHLKELTEQGGGISHRPDPERTGKCVHSKQQSVSSPPIFVFFAKIIRFRFSMHAWNTY